MRFRLLGTPVEYEPPNYVSATNLYHFGGKQTDSMQIGHAADKRLVYDTPYMQIGNACLGSHSCCGWPIVVKFCTRHLVLDGYKCAKFHRDWLITE